MAQWAAVQLEKDDRSGSVLIVHPDRKAQRTLQRVLASTLRPVEVIDPDGAKARAAASPGTICVVDQRIAHARPDLAGSPACGWIAVPSDDTAAARPDAVAALLEAGWRHVIGAPLTLSADELVATAQKLLRREVFGLEKYLGWAATVQTVRLDDATDRPDAVAALVEGVTRSGLSDRMVSLASVIADELLANAIWSAPVDADGGHPHRDTPRDTPRRLTGDPRDAVRLRWACDSRLLAVEVVDGWGSLDPALPGPLVARSSRRAARHVHAEPGGDGMGMALAYACCHQLVLGVAPGRRTEVIALIDVRHRPSDIGRAPSLHVFVEEPS